jgi:hypothetical protein
VLSPPLGFVAVDVAADLSGPGAEPTRIGRELADLAGLRVQGEPVGRENGSEAWIGDDRGVPDAVDRLDAVADAD